MDVQENFPFSIEALPNMRSDNLMAFFWCSLLNTYYLGLNVVLHAKRFRAMKWKHQQSTCLLTLSIRLPKAISNSTV